MGLPPQVNTIIPVRNGEKYLAQTIESALAQTYPNLAVTVIDDGSTDSSPKIADSYGGRVRCISTATRGVSSARNMGIDQTSGEFIALLDADDLWYREKISHQVECLQARPECCLVHTLEQRIDESGNPVELPQDERHFKKPEGICVLDLLHANTVVTSSVLMRRAALGSDRFDLDLCGCEDFELWLRLALRAPFAYLPEPLTSYRKHSGGISLEDGRMTRDTLMIFERVVRWNVADEVRDLARARWLEVKLRRARRAYARGEYRVARQLFDEYPAALPLNDRLRRLATYFPQVWVRGARRIASSLR